MVSLSTTCLACTVHRLDASATAHPPTMTLSLLHATPKVAFFPRCCDVWATCFSAISEQKVPVRHTAIMKDNMSMRPTHQTSPNPTTRRCHHRRRAAIHLMPRKSSGLVANPVPTLQSTAHRAMSLHVYRHTTIEGRESALLRGLPRHQITTCLKLMIAFTNNVRWTVL